MSLPLSNASPFAYTTLFRSQPGRSRGIRAASRASFDVALTFNMKEAPGLEPGASYSHHSHLEEDGYQDRKSTRLNSSHVATSYAVFCWKKKSPAAHCTRREP